MALLQPVIDMFFNDLTKTKTSFWLPFFCLFLSSILSNHRVKCIFVQEMSDEQNINNNYIIYSH